jgi:hypothetical protein
LATFRTWASSILLAMMLVPLKQKARQKPAPLQRELL